MRKLLSLDNPFVQFMERIWDYCVINLLIALLSFPVITLGAAFTAGQKVMQDFMFDNEQPIVRSFFRSFARNFKQSTIVWLFALLAIGFFAFDAVLIYVFVGSALYLPFYLLLGSIAVVVFGSALYAFSLIARYENTLKQHLRNSVLLAIGYLPRTVVMVFFYILPILLCVLSGVVDIDAGMQMLATVTLVFVFFGFSILSFLQARLMKPVLMKLEKTPEDSQQTEDILTESEQQEISL